MKRKYSDDQIAQILVEAAYYGDAFASERHRISRRTILRWREYAENSPYVTNLIKQKKSAFDKAWADDAISAFREGFKFLNESAKEVSRSDPGAIHAVAGALKIISEILITREVLDARLAAANRLHDSKD